MGPYRNSRMQKEGLRLKIPGPVLLMTRPTTKKTFVALTTL